MVTAELPMPGRVVAEGLTFRDGVAGHGGRPNAPRETTPRAGGLATSFDHVDEAIEALARRQGRGAAEVASARLTVLFESDGAQRLQRTLTFSVRRDRGEDTFTATCALPGIWGHGETIGEAFLDGLADLSARSEILARDRDRLGPRLERQAAAIERWGRAAE